MNTDNNIVTFDETTNTCKILLNDVSCDESYMILIDCIQNKYDEKKYFKLDIDTKNLEHRKIKMKYLYELSCFMINLKKQQTHYLVKSVIHVYDEFTNNLLYTLFTFLSKPIAPVDVILYHNRNCTSMSDTTGIKSISNYFP